jgi:dTDP-4-dehydrorhamnose 3,5-epimerase
MDIVVEQQTQIAGVHHLPLEMHQDDRGVFTELFRMSWGLDVEPVQWNVVRSEPGVLRGVHVHPKHDDYLVLLEGRATIGLRDLRRGSATFGGVSMVELTGERLSSLVIPHGVAHGFLFHERSTHVYSVSHYWDTADELACVWSDAGLGMSWPFAPTSLSERDAGAQPLSQLLVELEPWQPF